MIASRLFKNQFSQDFLPIETIKSISSYIVGKTAAGLDLDLARFDINTDNLNKSIVFKTTKKGESYSFTELNLPHIQVNTDSPFANIIRRSVTAIPLANDDNVEIGFDKFKDIIFALPFISDLIRASCGFNYSLHENFIKVLNSVRIEISSVESSKLLNFVFAKHNVFFFIKNRLKIYQISRLLITI